MPDGIATPAVDFVDGRWRYRWVVADGVASVWQVIHERALAYALGLEGLALLRAFAGEHGREFTDARIAEIRALLDDPGIADAAAEVEPVDTVEGYRVWSRTYDEGRNSAFDADEPTLHAIVEALPPGVAVDAACGTGRQASYLVGRGHRVIGVDGSEDMLAHARRREPAVEFRQGHLTALPIEDASADLVMCTLSLTHVPDLAPVYAEFARVLRPGGSVVTSDLHPELPSARVLPRQLGAEGTPTRLPAHPHRVGDHLRAALAAGLRVRRCEEPVFPRPPLDTDDTVTDAPRDPGPWEWWPWTVADLIPHAARAATAGVPVMLIWHFERDTT